MSEIKPLKAELSPPDDLLKQATNTSVNTDTTAILYLIFIIVDLLLKFFNQMQNTNDLENMKDSCVNIFPKNITNYYLFFPKNLF
ncbi:MULTISPECIES: hypothetical protein [Leptospira]|nr:MULTISPECIES: hypothetical protein [Leptospira]MCH1887624.1 hypothetical protein [Leptospira interrogans]MCH1893935.1 hypothetical protein [Leptospira interrogans]MCH1900682.1 hypothetical protein [Leptospira interrogans]MCH1904140.1 hypothetical protein [Leptospira interrogans]MCL8311006.1 hypothetical protein [Leptospira interrogans]